MKTNLFLTIALFSFSFFAHSQIDNQFSGTSAGTSITTGDNNVGFGDKAGTSLSSGSNNVFIGREAGFNQTTAFDNVFIGKDSGRSNITGTDNVFIGVEAGFNNTATDNIFIGTEAGEFNTSGSDNIFIGEESGTNNTTGSDNVFLGEDAGFNNTTASDNTFLGNTAGRQNTIGFRNTYIGNEAGYDSTEGYKNTFVGDSTGIDNSVGRLNTFIGQAAGAASEHADYNTFVGSYSGGDNNRTNLTTNANRNTYVGIFSGYSNREGEDNVGMGAFANFEQGFDILNITGRTNAPTSSIARSRTTFIGAQAHPNNNDVISIGYRSRVDGQFGITIGNESTVVGNYAVAIGQNVIVSQSNTMALGGNLETNRLSVGIGTVSANPSASLDLGDTDKGLLLNRLTTIERNDMSANAADGSPLDSTDAGMMVYDVTEKALFVWDGTEWGEIGAAPEETSSSSIPELLNYKAIIKDDNGNVLASAPLNIQFTIYEGAALTNNVYQESHTINTNENGLVIVNIGGGATGDDFSAINWGDDEHYFNVQINIGSGLVDLGTAPFVSVPYALRAKYAENLDTGDSTRSEDRAKRIEALEKEVKELKEMVSKLLKPKN